MTDTRPLVVVGADGSASAAEAVTWAADYASMAGADLELVTAWHFPTSYGVAMPLSGWDPEAEAVTISEKSRAAVSLPDDRVRTRIVHGAAAVVLADRSRSAHLLVVGSRGHGGFAGLLLGSVSAHCVHHAACPVVVVR
jgi:nucleotide-binding universal stress UspA family protein